MDEKQRAYHRAYYHSHVGPKKRTGKPTGRPPSGLTPFERVMARVEKEPDGCWSWTGPVLRGYGSMFVAIGSSPQRVHRIVWQELRGVIAAGLQLDHLCRNTRCVNPDHLEPVTPLTNTLRSNGIAALNTKKTECPQGHAFTAENTYLFRGKRACLVCRKAASKRGSDRRKAARHAKRLAQ